MHVPPTTPVSTGPYPHTFSPIQIGGVVVPNRVVCAAHATGLPRAGIVGPELIAYHESRARGGVGLIILEASAVHPSTSGWIRAWDDAAIPGYEALMSTLRKYPVKVFQQLWHAGRLRMTPDGGPPWSASPIPGIQIAVTPHEMTVAEIQELVGAWAAAARRASKGGLDGVEIHAAHGYLIGQFLSPLSNHREDDYGGSFDNRLRFLREILTAVRAEVGKAMVLGVRISADEYVTGGLRVADSIRIAQALESARLIDYLNISLGSHMNYPKVSGAMDEPLGYELPLSVPVARSVSVPTIVGGRIKSLAQVEELIAGGDADLVQMVRQAIADPDLVRKSREGHAARVRPCIALNQGCLGHNGDSSPTISCTVNPLIGMESRHPGFAKVTRRRVVIAGAGPAGMEAARVAAERGHEVILCESADRLGGQAALARRAPHLSELGDFVDWLSAELAALRVEVRLNTTVTPELAAELRPDSVVVATGSRPRTDGFQIARPTRELPGAERLRTSWEVLADDSSLRGRRALLFDDVGHYEAAAVADYLLERGASVTWVSRLPTLAPQVALARLDVRIKERLFPRRDFTFFAEADLVSIEDARVTVGSLYGGPERIVDADIVVMISSNLPEQGLLASLKGSVSDLHMVGDAVGPRFLQTAISEGHRAGLAIGGP